MPAVLCLGRQADEIFDIFADDDIVKIRSKQACEQEGRLKKVVTGQKKL